MKRVQDTCFKNSLVVLQFSSFASPQAKNDFWPDHLLWTAIESVNFKDFVHRAATATLQLQDVFS